MIREGKLEIDRTKAETDAKKSRDEVMMDLLKVIGNDIHKSIQLETDFPSKNADKKLPILNLRVWLQKVNELRVIMYEHYRKEVATKMTIHARAAMSTRQKKTILTQELLTVMRNCHP